MRRQSPFFKQNYASLVTMFLFLIHLFHPDDKMQSYDKFIHLHAYSFSLYSPSCTLPQGQ